MLTKNEVISTLIIGLVNEGTPVRDAVDAVLGAGTYEKIASDIWEEMNK